MKNITLILLLFSAAALTMTTGCGSDDTSTTPSDNTQDSTPTVSIENQIQIVISEPGYYLLAKPHLVDGICISHKINITDDHH